jgi:hypothetical protein
MPTRTYQIPMGTLFSKQANSDTNYGDMDAESLSIKQDEQRRAEMARVRLLQLMEQNSNISDASIPTMLNQTLTANFQNPLKFEPLSVKQPTSSDVGMMFSPEISRAAEMEYLQKRQGDMRARAITFAQLSPMQQADYGFYRGGQQLGDAIGGALGGQDPQLQLITQRQQLLSQLDRGDPESYKKIALQAQRIGDSELATIVSDAGRKLELDTSLIKQRNREKEGADPFEQLLRSGKYTPASMATYKVSQNVADLREVDSPDKVPADIQKAYLIAKSKGLKEGTPEHNAEIVKQLEKTEKERSIAFGTEAERKSKTMYGKPYADLTPEESGKVDLAVEKSEREKAKAGTSPQQMQRKAILANKTDLAKIVEENAFDASDRLTLARNLKTLLPQAFTGFGSDVLLEASRLAEVFGINIEGVSKSQIIDTILGQLTIGAASNLKGSLSDKDVKFLKETIGTRGLSIRTLQYVADRIEENALIDSGLNDALATYLADEKNDLNKYNFAAERKRITDQIRKDKKRLKELREKQQKSQ